MPTDAELAVYALLGRRAALRSAGPHEAVSDLNGAAPGVYVARLATDVGTVA